MDKDTLNGFIASPDISIVEAMGKIDKNGCGLVFIVNDANALIGCVTDGDIRRSLLKTGDLQGTVENAMFKTPVYLRCDEAIKAKDVMVKRKITAVPIVDDNRKIIDIKLLSEYLSKPVTQAKSSLKGTPVVIMAGGKGTRLYPYTKILPKPLIPIGDTPIVERILNCYVEYEIQSVYMTVNYKKEMIKSYFSEAESKCSIEFVEEKIPLGTCGSIKLIRDKIEKPMIIANCDALILADYADIYKHHCDNENYITIVSALKNTTIPYGVLHSKENGELSSIEEKPQLSYFINTGMYIINPGAIDFIPDNKMFHMTQLVDAVMAAGKKVGVYPISEDSFLDMGEFDEMRRMEEKLQNVVGESK